MAPKRTIAPRITDTTRDLLTETFKTTNAGAEYVLDSWPGLYRQTLTGLKGKFPENELILILNVLSTIKIRPEFAGRSLANKIIDGIALDGLAEKHQVDGPELSAKIFKIAPYEAATLEIWAKKIWVDDAEPDQEIINQYVKQLV